MVQSTLLRRVAPFSWVRRHHCLRGAALVEFAIVLPVLVMVVFGAWEFGRIFDAWQVSTNASREGARYGVESNLTGPQFQGYVRDKVQGYIRSGYGSGRLDVGDVHIQDSDIQVTTPDLTTGLFTVTVTAHVDIWAPAVGGLVTPGNTFAVTAWTTMRN